MRNLHSVMKSWTLVLCGVLFVSLMNLKGQGQVMPQRNPAMKSVTQTNVAGPELVAPAEKAVLTNYPRETKFEWQALPGAKEYEIQVEFNDGHWKMLKNEKIAGLTANVNFPGDNPGRWRVRAVLEKGTFTRWSERVFSYKTSSSGPAANNRPAVRPEGKPGVNKTLGVPQLLGPSDGTTFSETPRKTKLDWGTVEGASGYETQVEYKAGNDWKLLKSVRQKETSLTVNFVGAQPGRWRVCALAEGKRGPFTEWSHFSYTK